MRDGVGTGQVQWCGLWAGEQRYIQVTRWEGIRFESLRGASSRGDVQ